MAKTPQTTARVLAGAIILVGLTGCGPAATEPAPSEYAAFTPAARSCPEFGGIIAGDAGALVWTLETGAESWSTPVIARGSAIYGANDGVLRSVNADTGELQWELATDGAIRSEPLLVDETLYVSSDDGSFYAVSLDGELLWSTQIGSGDRGDYFFNYGSRAELARDILVVASGDGVVHALELETGEPRWTFDTHGPVQTNIAIGDGLAYVSSDIGTVYGIDLATGEEVWSRSTGAAATTHPAYSDGIVFVGSRSTKLLALDAATGSVLWEQKYGSSWVQSGATVVDDTVITGSSDIGEVRAYTAEAGFLSWSTKIGGWAWGTPVECNGALYTTSMRPERIQPWDVAVHALSAEDGSLLWQAGAGPALEWQPDGLSMYGVAASPAVAPNTVVVPGLDGVLYGFQR